MLSTPPAPEQFELVQTARFESARRLPKTPQGHPCHQLYGLAFYLDIHVVGSLDPDTGWVFDFSAIESAFKKIRDRIDHHYLNDIEGLENPTSEMLIRWIWHKLKPDLPGMNMLVLRENDVSRVIFRG